VQQLFYSIETLLIEMFMMVFRFLFLVMTKLAVGCQSIMINCHVVIKTACLAIIFETHILMIL